MACKASARRRRPARRMCSSWPIWWRPAGFRRCSWRHPFPPRGIEAVQQAVRSRGFDVGIGGGALRRCAGRSRFASGYVPRHDARKHRYHRGRPCRGPRVSIRVNDPTAIEVRDLTVAYRDQPVLWDIDLTVPSGVLMAVVGPNGAGENHLRQGPAGAVEDFRRAHPLLRISVRGMPAANRLCAATGQRRLGFPDQRARCGDDGAVRAVGMDTETGQTRARTRPGSPGKGGYGRFRRPADPATVRRAAATRFSGARADPGRPDIPDGRTLSGGRRRHRTHHYRPAARTAGKGANAPGRTPRPAKPSRSTSIM